MYLILTKWGYPFGGGEEFLYQTMKWVKGPTYWISYTNPDNTPYETFKITREPHGTLIQVPFISHPSELVGWLRLLKPTVVHHQGADRLELFKICYGLGIKFITGIHFWNGVIKLNPITYNINIEQNTHEPDPEFITLLELAGGVNGPSTDPSSDPSLASSSNLIIYSPSDFVKKVISNIFPSLSLPIVYAASSQLPPLSTHSSPRFVTLINIHKLKGGEILLHLLKTLPSIPFMAIRTEPNSENLDKEIKKQIKQNGNSLYIGERIKNIKFIYQNTKILLAPSLVDETFCRTVNEAMMHGIPVLSTGSGNIKYLLKDSGYIIPPTDLNEWTKVLGELYSNDKKLAAQKVLTLSAYSYHSEAIAINQFLPLLTPIKTLMIFAPWCDQGLGIQARNYRDILNPYYNISIFSYKPYNAGSCIELQKKPEEWLIDNIYYSPNDRERVTDIELCKFVRKYGVVKCLIPETCFSRIFEIGKLLKSIGVKVYAIPNIEIVRKDEVYKHKVFHKILCNNYLCKNIFQSYGFKNAHYIGYGIRKNENVIDSATSAPHLTTPSSPINFLFIGGMNAFSRKHILDICEAFTIAHSHSPNITLTCTIQMTNALEVDDIAKLDKYKTHPNITMISSHLSYNKIQELYQQSHISIQVSKHEGLGLGFYEAISHNVPVITLNTPPHNEIIKDNINGFIIPCHYRPMTDNKDPLFDSAYFDPQDLANKIKEISDKGPESWKNMVFDGCLEKFVDNILGELDN